MENGETRRCRGPPDDKPIHTSGPGGPTPHEKPAPLGEALNESLWPGQAGPGQNLGGPDHEEKIRRPPPSKNEGQDGPPDESEGAPHDRSFPRRAPSKGRGQSPGQREDADFRPAPHDNVAPPEPHQDSVPRPVLPGNHHAHSGGPPPKKTSRARSCGSRGCSAQNDWPRHP